MDRERRHAASPRDDEAFSLGGAAQARLFQSLPQWFIAIAGLIYATGFLVVFSFFERFGLRETGVEFFKAKFFHVGILCLMFPVIVLVPLFAFVGIKRMTKQEQQRRAAAGDSNAAAVPPPSLVGMLLTMDLLMVFYLFVVHVPPGHFLEKQLPLTLLFVTTTVGVLGANTLQEKKGRPRLVRFGKGLKVALIPPAVWFSLWSLHGVGLRAIFEEAGLAFFFFAGFMSMTALSIYRVQRRVGTESHAVTVGAALIACSFGAVSYFLGVLAFAVGLYPFIPVARGGGDYSDTGFVTLRFRRAPNAPSPREGVPPEVLCGGEDVNQSQPLRLIEMTQTDAYVAAGDPTKWRRGPRPRVSEIRREAVSSITYSKEEVQCPAEPKKPPTELSSPTSGGKRRGGGRLGTQIVGD